MYIHFNDLEAIHKSLPQLVRLQFDSVLLGDPRFNMNIESATSVTALVLSDLRMFYQQTRIFLLDEWTLFFESLAPQLKKLRLRNSGLGSFVFVTLDKFGCKIEQLEVNTWNFQQLRR
ncbi:hypothetical protein K501DRAFT_273839 [Backusella circina FSU 941]|nr:hypothetical protein K501DRAFT_273839 [Backusella circina FSU 941]